MRVELPLLSLLASSVRTIVAPGCTDPAASNFALTESSDDGRCSYDCATLDARQSWDALLHTNALDPVCYIFANGSWPAALTGKATASPSCPDQARTLLLADGDRWIVQGRPLAGAARLEEAAPPPPLQSLQALRNFRFHLVANTQLRLRYTHIPGVHSPDCYPQAGCVLVEEGARFVAEVVLFGGGAAPSSGGVSPVAAAAATGGGILARTQASVVVSQSTFDRLQNEEGGGLWANSATVSITASRFTSCSSSRGGGGVYAASSNLSLASVSFSSNDEQLPPPPLHANVLKVVAKNLDIFPSSDGDPPQS